MSRQAISASLQGKLNDTQLASADVAQKKLALMGRLAEFNRKVRGFLSHTIYAAALPDVPNASSAPGIILEALDDMASLWSKINAATIPGFTGPLTLLATYPIATLNTELAALKIAYAASQGANQDLDLERKLRTAAQEKAYAAVRDYRKAVLGLFAETDPMVLTLPKLSPEPGATPDPVTANISWDATQQKAKLMWPASTDPTSPTTRSASAPARPIPPKTNPRSAPSSPPSRANSSPTPASSPPATSPASKSTSSSPPATRKGAIPSPSHDPNPRHGRIMA